MRFVILEIDMNSFVDFFSNPKVKAVISIAAAVVMYFTPDHIDRVIETLLLAYGFDLLIIDTK